MSTAAAVILWTGATFYAIFGGADFGGGFWDLIAGNAKKGWEPRMAIQRSLTPVWEANHVWLVFILVVLWTAFPTVFSAIFSTLYVPLILAVLGIVLRGSGFAFRKSIEGLNEQRAAGATFALSSVITPFFMGTVVGAIAAGNVPAGGGGDAFSSWIAPLPLFIGAMFVATSAYMAAIFLVGDSRRAGDKAMELYFEKRALAAGAVAGIFAVVGLIALHSEGHYVYHRLLHEGLPVVIISAVCGLGALAALLLGNRLLLRPLAALAVIAVIWGWFVAQFPYLLPTSLTISEAAAPDATLSAVFVVFGVAVVLVLPALFLLYFLAQSDFLEHEH
ncbi:MAG TPA: cytochrome d ubiquinol oxidase subunit II [Solirubrobacterales bacterium]|jgi:cytochrome d ubiquinol oxidase subunit II|nr:cytochrome d ubiquinol oxidase subunit II [Solirubrobacterales bacterium]